MRFFSLMFVNKSCFAHPANADGNDPGTLMQAPNVHEPNT